MGFLIVILVVYGMGIYVGYGIAETKWKAHINELLEDQRKRGTRHSPNDSDIFP